MRRPSGNFNKIMLFGTAAVTDDGSLQLTELAKRRADRAAQAYFGHRFKRDKESILITGGYSRSFDVEPPVEREATLMADYLKMEYGLQDSDFLIEPNSTTTKENFEFSKQMYPEFFEEVVSGERKLGIVSHPEHLGRVAVTGCVVLECSEKQFVKLPAEAPVVRLGEGTLLSLERSNSHERAAADE